MGTNSVMTWRGNGFDGLIEEHPLENRLSPYSWVFKLMGLAVPVSTRAAPEVDESISFDSYGGHPSKTRSLISLIIALLVVFGAMYSLVEYLLFTTRASAACVPVTTTVFMPLTTTMTHTPSSSLVGDVGSATTSTIHSTLYSTSTMVNTVTIYPAMTSATVLSSSGGASYFYGVNSGTTSWLNGVSPSSGAVLTTATTSFFVSPMATLPNSASDTTITVQSTATDVETVTPPPYTSTTFSMVGPALTTISTSTRYTTIELSLATPSSRSSYPGVGSAGWNTSSSAVAGPTGVVNGTDAATTLTQSYYWGTGNSTTSTSTALITTTIAVGGTVLPLSTSVANSGPATALPSNSSDVAPVSATLSSAILTSSSTLSSAVTTLSSSITAGSPSTGYPLFSPGTSGVYANATSAAAATGPALSTPPPYAGPTGFMSLPSSILTTSSVPAASNSSLADGLTASLANTFTAINSSVSDPAMSQTTAAVVVPVTTTLSSGSEMTVVLETTSTTLGLFGSSSGLSTVSGYFVFNGTTTIPYMPGTATGAPYPVISGTLTWPISSSAVISPLITSQAPGPLPASNGSISYPAPTTTMSSPASSDLSIPVPVNDSSAALSAISSVISALTGPATSFVATTSSLASGSVVSATDTGSTTPNVSPAASSPSAAANVTATSSLPANSAYGSANSTVSSTSFPGASSLTVPVSTSSLSSSYTSVQASGIMGSISGLPSSTLLTSTLGSTLSAFAPPATSAGTVAVSSTVTLANSTSIVPVSILGTGTIQPYSLPTTATTVNSSSTLSNPFPASSATATPTACGEHGDFTLTFDGLPNFVPSNQNQTDITQAPPVPNPYNHLTFSDGYVYGPSPRVPYTPVSSPHLGVFLANASGITARSAKPGEIGDGPYEAMSAFWFDAHSAFLGCDNKGPDSCTMMLTGYTWSPVAGNEIAAYTQNASIAPCPSLKNCKLQQVTFPDSFNTLSGLQIQAFVGEEQRMFFMDDLALAWSNNTCAAGLMRERYQ